MNTKEERVGEAYIPQELLVGLKSEGNSLLIGLPCERLESERRLALTPESVALLTDAGHRVLLEKGAGLGINYGDNRYTEAGAEIVDTAAEVYQADIILKILPPLPTEVALMKNRCLLFSLVELNRFSQTAFEGLMAKRVHAVAYELMADGPHSFPVRTLISEIEGREAVSIASSLLSNLHGGKGLLLGGIPGISPTEVLVLGAGVAAASAAKAARAQGALVKVFDDDVNKLRVLRRSLGEDLFTSNFHPRVVRNAFRSADVVIGAMERIQAHRPRFITDDLIHTMKRGSLIIDLCMNQGGCFETTCGLTEDDPEVFEQYGILHYCRRDISNAVARTTSMAFSNVFVPLLLDLGEAGSFQALVKGGGTFASGVYLYGGKPVNSYVASHFNLLSNNLDIYLSLF
jgi:alanine dehydrogenase